MAKAVKTIVKLNLQAGQATAAPPVGSALGQHGVAIMDFVKQYNEKTKAQAGNIIPAVITIFEDRTFSFVTKLPPVSTLIKKTLNVESGSKKPSKESVGTLSQDQLRQIAEQKMPDLNANTVEAAMQIVAGTARSMGVKIA